MDRSPNSLPIIEHTCRRVDVLSGPERRRRWSIEEKARIVAESLAPGAVSGVVARRYDIHPNQLCGWRRELRLARTATVPASGFVPVMVAAAPMAPMAIEAPPNVGDRLLGGQIEIVLGLATVRVPPSADMATLRGVLDAVRSLS